MKLKELHIRNIASIERADIDFENGLNDAVTGNPAPIFLISGDTGAGKSVILDCISMALYKNTPRIESTANKLQNAYVNNYGESLNINSIEQYTRLGISASDECYSEVVFQGNDNKTYHARLKLGMMIGNRDRTTGIRPVKHRNPVWEYRVGNADWTTDNIGKTIRRAVGLEFQQFGRMAMLAQGQFANFLTGDKKERQDILEQLTDTQHFSAYGEAIQSLHKKAKDALARVQTQYDTEKPHTLTDEQVEQITREQTEAQKEIGHCEKEIKATERKLGLVDAVLRNEAALTEASRAKQELEATMRGEEYSRCKALFSDWDATTAQRQRLSDLMKARQDEARAKDGLAQARETFRLLTADIASRQATAKTQEETVRQLEDWVRRQAPYEELFTTAGETDLKIGQYLEKVKKAGVLSDALKRETDKTEGLKKAESEAKALAQAAGEVVRERQDQIDQLNRKRLELNPQAVIGELKTQNARRQELSDLQNAIGNLKPLTEENQKLEERLQTEECTLKTLLEARRKADADYQTRKEVAEKAAQRLTTMKMSLDEKIRELRHRLYDEHTTHCPLCGQQIEHISLDDDFKDMLTPFEEEQQQARESLERAVELRDQAMGNFKQLDGTHKGNLRLYDANKIKIEQAQKAIDDKAARLGLELKKDLSQQITEAHARLTLSVTRLEATQSEAERLQREINRLIDGKKTFDNNKTEADKIRLKAENALKVNADDITRIEKEHTDLIRECENVKADITAALTGYCNDWLADTEALRRQLKDDAKTYTLQRKRLADSQAELERAATLTGTLTQYSRDIIFACPDWTANSTPQPYTCSNINTEWTNLLGRVTSLVSKLQDSNSIITDATKDLEVYYRESGQTEQTLKTLVAQEQQVAASRKMVSETDAQLKSRNDAINDARQQIVAAYSELGISERAELPDRQILEEKKAADSTLRDGALSRYTQAKTQLELHQKNVNRLKEIEAELERAKKHFVRWDKLNSIFGGTRFRTLVQTYILRPLLNNANIYLEQITDRYRLTCSKDNEQLSILVLDRYNKDQVRSATVLSGGERFMISLALSLALSSLNCPDMNVNILFIDEGFGTLDEKSLDAVMQTLEKLQEIAGQTNRRVGIISHREELEERIPVKIQVVKKGEGRSMIRVKTTI